MPGGGGREYATRENGLWIEEGDHLGCARAPGEALDALTAQDGRYRELVAGGRRTAERFSLAGLSDALKAYWSRAAEP
jgi:hypothetical protein